MITAVCVMYSVSPGMDRVYLINKTAPVFWSTSMPHTRYLNSIPNKDGGACAGAWASTSLPRPAMGWTSPLPAVRMRAAMLVSAVVATCRGRRRRRAIREDVVADELHEWRQLSCEVSQSDCLRV